MTIRNLEAAFLPHSIAVIGASPREGSVGRTVLANIVASGFEGAIYPVNLKYTEVMGLRCYHQVAELPEGPDLAVIMTPPETVPGLVANLARRGTRLAVVLTAGIGTANGLRQAMLDAARPALMRLIGPNTIGLISPRAKLNASFAHIAPIRGRLGLISQSGAIVSSVIDWAAAEGIGFSEVLSLGDMADVDVGDCLNMLAADSETDAILVYLESISEARKFMSAARAAARIKPVIALKPGRHAEAAKAAMTHTGALAGADRVVDAALRRAGIIRVDDLDDLFNAAEITARFKPLTHGRVALVTNGGGAGVLAVDQLIDQGCALATLSTDTMTGLDAALPATWSHANPVDIIGDAPPERYRAAVAAVAADEGVDAILVMNCPTALADPVAAATALGEMVEAGTINRKPVLACWLGKQAAEPARQVLQRAGVASFDTPAQAAEAVALLTRWSNLRRHLERVPSSEAIFEVDHSGARHILEGAAAEGRAILTEWEAKQVLSRYGIPVPETEIATDEAEVGRIAERMLGDNKAVVVKMLSKSVSHKSDIGGVVLNLSTADAARQAAVDIRARFVAHNSETPLDGFTVQPMVVRRRAEELIAGISSDPVFGPVILFGAGGTAVEVVDDTATGIVPLDAVLAADLIGRTRVSRLLRGYRDRPPANLDMIVRSLLALSQLATDHAAIKAVDINPLLADTDGVIALDARIEIDPVLVEYAEQNPRLAIRPYPAGWDSDITLMGADYHIRPILPRDAALYPDFLERMQPDDMRMRFLVPRRTIAPDELVRLTQLDYDRDIAFVALEQATGALVGIVRYSADPDRRSAEFGILLRSDLKRRGLGMALMQQLIAYAEAEHIGTLTGIVLQENMPMLELCRRLGFTIGNADRPDHAVNVTLAISSLAPAG
ncbi:MAG TPA: bifunctional acetate--CoA ligase family protein/GNAT family N-acetyltransferase [Devosia sp.]|nr:bifunctional acetate--CoA ligase family protein/GNAT family N-acetyltransferase [Devosia sp.]